MRRMMSILTAAIVAGATFGTFGTVAPARAEHGCSSVDLGESAGESGPTLVFTGSLFCLGIPRKTIDHLTLESIVPHRPAVSAPYTNCGPDRPPCVATCGFLASCSGTGTAPAEPGVYRVFMQFTYEEWPQLWWLPPPTRTATHVAWFLYTEGSVRRLCTQSAPAPNLNANSVIDYLIYHGDERFGCPPSPGAPPGVPNPSPPASPAHAVVGQGTVPGGAKLYLSAVARDLSFQQEGRGVLIFGGTTVTLSCVAVVANSDGNRWLLASGNVMFSPYDYRYVLGYDSATTDVLDHLEVSATSTWGNPCYAPSGNGLQPLTGPGLVVVP